MNFVNSKIIASGPATEAQQPNVAWVWAAHLTILAVLTTLLAWMNSRAIANAVQVWWVSPTYSHCFLVVPVSAYFAWRKGPELASVVPSAFPLALLLAPPLVFLSIAGSLAGINEAEQVAFIGLFQVLTLALLGPAVYRKLLFPCLFLFFLVPTGDYLVVPLQRFTTDFVTVGLDLLGIPHRTEGFLVTLSNGAFEVAEACAGLRFLIATIAIGVLFVRLTYRKWQKTILFLIACLVIPVIANGLRALGIVLVADWTDNRIAAGVDHIVYGWGFLVAILLLLMLIGARYADPIRTQGRSPPAVRGSFHGAALLLTAGMAVVAVCFGPAFVVHRELSRPSRLNAAAFSAPLSLAGWQNGTISGGWSPDFVAPDARLAFAMRETGSSPLDVDVFVNYYAGTKGSRSLLSAGNALWNQDLWRSISESTVETDLGLWHATVSESVISSGGLRRVVWWTYWTAGRFTTSGRNLKLEELRHVFFGSSGSALVALSTLVPSDLAEARARLDRAFKSLDGVARRLEQTSLD